MLSNLVIEGGVDTPAINFDAETGILSIEGKSFPPDIFAFYDKVLQWLKQYFKQPQKKTILKLKLDYFNTASSKILMDILYMLEEYYNKGVDILIEWYYQDDDEDMQETGEEYAQLVNVPFKNIGYKFIIE